MAPGRDCSQSLPRRSCLGFHLKPEEGRGVVLVSKTLKEAALWRGPVCQALGDMPGSERSFALLTTAKTRASCAFSDGHGQPSRALGGPGWRLQCSRVIFI